MPGEDASDRDLVLRSFDGRNPVDASGGCEDCGGEVEPGVKPLGLFRRVPGSPAGQVYDTVKRKWVTRRGQAAAGGRRWREYRLCRRCRGEALRQRSAKSGTVMEGGKKRTLRPRERVAPKKGGRPRLLSDEQIRAAHVVYTRGNLSALEVGRRLQAAGVNGTANALSQLLVRRWREMGLTVRPTGVSMAMARFGTDGTKTKPRKQRCRGTVKHGARKGQRCKEYAMRDSEFCVGHQS